MPSTSSVMRHLVGRGPCQDTGRIPQQFSVTIACVVGRHPDSSAPYGELWWMHWPFSSALSHTSWRRKRLRQAKNVEP